MYHNRQSSNSACLNLELVLYFFSACHLLASIHPSLFLSLPVSYLVQQQSLDSEAVLSPDCTLVSPGNFFVRCRCLGLALDHRTRTLGYGPAWTSVGLRCSPVILIAEKVEHNRESRTVIPKQGLLLEFTENLKILSRVGRKSGICMNSWVISIIGQIQKQLKSFSLSYPLQKQNFVQELGGINILCCRELFKY